MGVECTIIGRLCCLFILASISIQSVWAQENRCLDRVLVAGVLDEHGNPVRGLGLADFRAEFGKHARILSVTQDTGPRRLILVLDASSSMADDPSSNVGWDLILFTTTEFVSRQPQQNSVALLVFASQVIQKISFAEDRKKILDTLASLKDWRKVLPKDERRTALWESLVTASDMLDPPQLGDAIFVITDGGDNLSHRHSREDAERAFKIRAIRVFAIMPISPQTRTPEEEEGSSRLVELTKETGGNAVAFPQRYMTPAELAPALIPVFRQMNEIYRLEVELPQALDKFRSWKLEFAEPRSPKTKHATIIYPRQLAPCQ